MNTTKTGNLIQTLLFIVCIAASLLAFMPGRSEAITKYRWPLANQAVVSYYMDDNASAGVATSYACGPTTYDTHDGTDIPQGYGTPILNGATGSLYYRDNTCPLDGPNNGNQSCAGGLGNHVRIQSPSDGVVGIYAHMKYNTPANLMSATCSATVGQVGSSGKSSGYHLHFGVWSSPSRFPMYDPYNGACQTAQPTRWVQQNDGAGVPVRICQ